jgi:hypothetical protein
VRRRQLRPAALSGSSSGETVEDGVGLAEQRRGWSAELAAAPGSGLLVGGSDAGVTEAALETTALPRGICIVANLVHFSASCCCRVFRAAWRLPPGSVLYGSSTPVFSLPLVRLLGASSRLSSGSHSFVFGRDAAFP